MSVSSSSHSGDWGAHYDDNFKGIPHKRSCTDIYCLFILIFFVFCWFAIGYYAYWNGDISRLTALRDWRGRTCGVDEDVADAKYLMFFDITKCVSLSVFIFGCPTKQICVEKCPAKRWNSAEVVEKRPINWAQVRASLICDEKAVANRVNSVEMLEKVINEGHCIPYYFNSTSALFLSFLPICLPNPLQLDSSNEELAGGERSAEYRDIRAEILESSKQAQNYFSYAESVIRPVLQDLKKCWHLIIYFVLTSAVICLFVILIMGIVTKIVVWFILSTLVILLFCGSVVTYIRYSSMEDAAANSSAPDNYNSTYFDHDFYSETAYGHVRWLFQQKQTWFILFVASTSFFVLFSLLVIFLRSRIGIAVMLIGEGSKAINRIKSTLCFPLVYRTLQLAVMVWFVFIFLYVKSLGSSVYTVQGYDKDADCRCRNYREADWCLPHQFNDYCRSISTNGTCIEASCVFKEFRSPKLKLYFFMYNFFGLLWGLYFVSGLGRMILSYCFATWYWTYNKYDIPFFTLTYSVYVTVRYHLGTVAFGSFLIATLGFIRAILEYMQRTFKQTDGLVMQCINWSLRACFWCLQKFLIYISNNAYVMCSVMGTSFFSSAQEAFGLITRNILRVIVLDKVLDFLMLIGKFSVTLIIVLISYFTFSAKRLSLNYPEVPTAIVGIIAWIISSSFFGVYTIAVDTLFLSFLKDGEMNDGSKNRPYYMSHKLKYILKEKLKPAKRKNHT